MSLLFLYDYNDYNDYNYCKYYNYYSVYNDYRDSDLDLDLDLDWERFSDLVTQLTITDKLRNLNHDIHWGVVIYNQTVTWTALAILAMFEQQMQGLIFLFFWCKT